MLLQNREDVLVTLCCRHVSNATVKSVDIHRAGSQKAEQVQPLILTCFGDAQQHQVIAYTLNGAIGTNNIPEPRKGFDRVLGIIVVPRYPVVI
jgi:hypothetical protein